MCKTPFSTSQLMLKVCSASYAENTPSTSTSPSQDNSSSCPISMTDLSATEIEQLLANVTNATSNYDGTKTVQGMQNRAAIRGAARELFLAMSTPEDHVWNQVFHVCSESNPQHPLPRSY